MTQKVKEEIVASIAAFRLPRYEEIPDVGLYLEQAVKYISEYLEPLEDITLTTSMVSNYVKKGLLPSPVKKQYGREQIAHLFFIAVAKTVMSIEDIRILLELQRRTYKSQRAYDYFALEFENVLRYVLGIKENLDNIGVDATDEKEILRNIIITVAHKVYLDKRVAILHEEEKE